MLTHGGVQHEGIHAVLNEMDESKDKNIKSELLVQLIF